MSSLKTMDFDAVKDSGARREFDTGSRRDIRSGKGRFDLINPIPLRRLAKHYENGGAKYGDHNWELGQPMMSYLDSALRHINTFIEGHRDEDHMAAAAWNIFAAIYTEVMVNRGILPTDLNDMPNYLSFDGFDASVGRMTRAFNERKKAEEVAKSAIQIPPAPEWDREVHP